jgi:hypothetical protein
MQKQNYHHHKRYYPPHHFVFLPMMTVMIAVGIRNSFREPDHLLEWILFALLSFSVLYLGLMVRQHYALGNQDRIVRLEFRLRYFEIFGESSKDIEPKLGLKKIAALRFADDFEFRQLLDRAMNENLSSDEIKKSIRHWQADEMRL